MDGLLSCSLNVSRFVFIEFIKGFQIESTSIPMWIYDKQCDPTIRSFFTGDKYQEMARSCSVPFQLSKAHSDGAQKIFLIVIVRCIGMK